MCQTENECFQSQEQGVRDEAYSRWNQFGKDRISDARRQESVHSKVFTRFRTPWRWDGGPAVLQSRAWDEAGNVQPTRAQIVAARGEASRVPNVNGFPSQHYNGPTSWGIESDGEVRHVYA